VRVLVRQHRPRDGANHYERDLRDVLVLQSELAEAIARELRVATHPKTHASRSAEGPSGVAPRSFIWRALSSRPTRRVESKPHRCRDATGIVSAGSRRRLTLRWAAGLAGVYGFLADYGYAPFQPTLDTARMMARRAVALDSMLPETRTALAVTLRRHDFVGAEREFRRAIKLGPSNARAHYWYSVLLVALGRGEEALREADRALALDPFSPRGGLAMKRYAPSGHRRISPPQTADRTAAADSLNWSPVSHGALASAGNWGGRPLKEARSEIVRAREGAPGDNFRMLPWVATVQWWCGSAIARPRTADANEDIPARTRERLSHGDRSHSLGEKDSGVRLARSSALDHGRALRSQRGLVSAASTQRPAISGAAAAPRRSTSVVNSPTRLRLRSRWALIATVIAPAAGPRLGSQLDDCHGRRFIRGIDAAYDRRPAGNSRPRNRAIRRAVSDASGYYHVMGLAPASMTWRARHGAIDSTVAKKWAGTRTQGLWISARTRRDRARASHRNPGRELEIRRTDISTAYCRKDCETSSQHAQTYSTLRRSRLGYAPTRRKPVGRFRLPARCRSALHQLYVDGLEWKGTYLRQSARGSAIGSRRSS